MVRESNLPRTSEGPGVRLSGFRYFSVDSAASMTVGEGSSGIWTFTANSSGTLPYKCDQPKISRFVSSSRFIRNTYRRVVIADGIDCRKVHSREDRHPGPINKCGARRLVAADLGGICPDDLSEVTIFVIGDGIAGVVQRDLGHPRSDDRGSVLARRVVLPTLSGQILPVCIMLPSH